jgi:oligopeptide transport system permease protein
MIEFVLKRGLVALVTLFALMAVTFVLLRYAPGGPFDTDRAWPPEVQANINRRYELDRPVSVQFFHWVEGAVHGDFRESFQYIDRSVSSIIAESLPVSMGLGVLALFVSIGVGIPAGAFAAWKRGRAFDRASTFLLLAGISIPPYLVAGVMILYFSLHLGWFPPALLDSPSSLVLPVFVLALRPIVLIARLTRVSMIETLGLDYIRTAESKGVPPFFVIFKHALKNSVIPVVTTLGPIAANLVTGSFLVEVIFNLPGIGKHFVQAVLNRDYPLVMGVTLVYGVILISCNLLVDVLYGVIDPRIRVEAKA